MFYVELDKSATFIVAKKFTLAGYLKQSLRPRDETAVYLFCRSNRF